ncbi:MAG: hypothetical protein KKF44_00645 [Nanoarchaeota archaeon]|nr:hypothetical protein [Nanoarchaeota archaeon]
MKENYIDESRKMKVQILRNVVNTVLDLRKTEGLNLNWPLKEAIIVTHDNFCEKALKQYENLVKSKINVGDVIVKSNFPGLETKIKLSYSEIEKDFPSIAPKIFVEMTKMQGSAIEEKLKKGEGSFDMRIDGKSIKIELRHLISEKAAPKNYIKQKFTHGEIFLNTESSKVRLSIGFSNEIIEKIDSIRKKIQVSDDKGIEIYLKASEELKEILINYENYIQKKAGAETFMISKEEPEIKYEYVEEGVVRGLKYSVHINTK